ncbi:MAG: DUF4369 domain-containing protein [Mucilaginibacter sp.]
MRLTLLVTLGLLPVIALTQQPKTVPYQLNAEVNFPKGDETGRKIYFVYQQNGRQKTDSTIIANNKCSFSGMADITIKASLQLTKPNATPEPALDPNTLSLYLNNGLTDVKATGFLSRAQVVGSPVQDEYAAFMKKYGKWDRPIVSAGRRKRNLAKTDTLKLKAINKTLDSLQNLKMADLSAFLNEGIAKPYAIEALLMYLKAKGSSLDTGKAEGYFKQLPREQQQSAGGLEAEKIIADLKKHN